MVLFIIFLVLAAVFVGSLGAVYYMAFYTNRKLHPASYDMPAGSQYEPYIESLTARVRYLEKIPYEPVEIKSYDGLKLFGRWYEAGKDAPIAIIFHGYRSSALRDASGGAPFCMKRGFSVLLVDQRAHGKSEGRTISFGINERRDSLSWIHYIMERFGNDVKIMLMGVSMGAATVLMAADLGLPESVKAVGADCSYSSPEEIIVTVAGRMGLHEKLVKPLARMSARIFGGFDLNESSAEKAAKNFKIPVLLIHGDDDRFVPCDMSRKIQKANPDLVSLTQIPGAGHGIAYYVDTNAYEDAAAIICDITDGI